MSNFFLAFLAILLALVSGTACSVYDPSLVGRGDSGVSDAGDSGGADGSGDASTTSHAVPPRRPEVPDGPDMPKISFALRDVQLDQGRGRWREIGFDLDGLITEDPDRLTTCEPPSGAPPPLDGDGGRDNVFGESLYPTIELAIEGLERSAQDRQAEGVGSILVTIDDYSGAANDPRVDVTLAVTVFGTTEDDQPTVTVDGSGTPRVEGRIADFPRWDGTDYFWAREDNFISGDINRPAVRDNNAYVAGGCVVARIPAPTDFLFPGDTIGVRARLSEIILMGCLTGDRQELQNVTLAGRWGLADLEEAGAAIGLCRGDGDPTILRNLLDNVADVRAEIGTGGPGVMCDAISVGIVFQGLRGRLGGVTPGPSLTDLCEP